MSIPIPGAIADVVRRSTVQVLAGRHHQGSGSGAVVHGSQVVTNAHVVNDCQDVTIESWDGRRIHAQVSKRDVRRDLALLAVSGLEVPPLIFGDSDRVRSGLPVLAVGNPLGFVGAASSGVVHSVSSRWIEADLRLAPGNSGGPLANLRGELIGINTMLMMQRWDGNLPNGLAFAVPSRAVQMFLSRSAPARTLGVTIRPLRLPDQKPALVVLETVPGGPADQASLLPGDLLTAANDKRLRDPEDLADAIENSTATMRVQFYRGWQNNGRSPLREVAVRFQPEPATHAA